jgi:hypothetical protein
MPASFVGRIMLASRASANVLAQVGIVPEPPEVAIAVERHRWAWRPANVRVLLIAESHVYTSAEDIKARVRRSALPPAADHAPTEFVRLVYCLGYGENGLLEKEPPAANTSGTWQFWDVFGRLAQRGRQPRKASPLRFRLQWKVDTLMALRELGVWLVDASASAIYTPGGHQRMSPTLRYTLRSIWLEHYGSALLDELRPSYRCIIGAGVAGILSQLGVKYDDHIYQPQGIRSVNDPDRGWNALIERTQQREQ